jgi:hypothetical protein
VDEEKASKERKKRQEETHVWDKGDPSIHAFENSRDVSIST